LAGDVQGTHWEDSKSIVVEKFEDAVASGVLINYGMLATIPIKIDARRSEKVLGYIFRSFEEQATSVAFITWSLPRRASKKADIASHSSAWTSSNCFI
jgi:hypothetical protein